MKLIYGVVLVAMAFSMPALAKHHGKKPQTSETSACAAASDKDKKKSESKESGEKGGTADINIGVGELQECTAEEAKPKRKKKRKDR